MAQPCRLRLLLIGGKAEAGEERHMILGRKSREADKSV